MGADIQSRGPSLFARFCWAVAAGLQQGCAQRSCVLRAVVLVAWLLSASHSAAASGEFVPIEGSVATVEGRQVAGPLGAVFSLPGKAILSLGPNTEATLIPKPQMLALNGAKLTPTYSVFLRSGKVEVTIPNNAGVALLVACPADVRVISQRGSSAVLASGRSSLVWTEREPLLISQKERMGKLRPGVVRRYAKDAPPEDTKVLEAPQWLKGTGLWLAMPDKAQLKDFAWSPVAGVASYRIEVRNKETGGLVAAASQVETSLNRPLELAPGNYELFVRGIDANTMPGESSLPYALQIVGVDVPAGAKLQPGARIEMSKAQTVQLKNANGLSLKRAREHQSRPASDPVGIADGQPTPLMIQKGDSSNAFLMWLLPMQSPVAAYVGPKRVLWPSDTVELEVRWVDNKGRRLPEDILTSVTVYVGIEPVDVTWDKQGDIWHATLSPQPGTGPWVVRLEVTDQAGSLLARDFVEVERKRGHYLATTDAGSSSASTSTK